MNSKKREKAKIEHLFKKIEVQIKIAEKFFVNYKTGIFTFNKNKQRSSNKKANRFKNYKQNCKLPIKIQNVKI